MLGSRGDPARLCSGTALLLFLVCDIAVEIVREEIVDLFLDP
jgi:hypothetical protein